MVSTCTDHALFRYYTHESCIRFRMVDPEKNFPWSQIIICAVVIELGIQKVNLHFQRASISLTYEGKRALFKKKIFLYYMHNYAII